ncbi:hypothetical protein [Butyrivibrio sp. WCD2001]|uniref:hypothetical protein n=1 Tax=Butyrivibrio sp. WCD2001 TaxID=1280681 RepID=UPI0003FE1141|nr:hypothetical protein [Butyrivibrio sp. WCD2001]
MEKNYYTVYLKKNEEVVATGTSKECAKQLQCSVGSFYSLVSRSISGKIKKYDVVIDTIDQ